MNYKNYSGFTYLYKLLSGFCFDAMEQSVKITDGYVNCNRFLAGIETSKLCQEEALSLKETMALPDQARSIFEHYYSQASSLLFGYESISEDRYLKKVYLEFWESIADKALNQQCGETELMHLGLKWPSDNHKQLITTEYHCRPLLDIRGIDRILSKNESEAYKTARAVLNIAATKSQDRSFVFLEAAEKDNCRSSIDLNLYKAKLQISDIAFPLKKYLSACKISDPESIINYFNEYPLGHISAGIDRYGRDFFSFYIEIM